MKKTNLGRMLNGGTQDFHVTYEEDSEGNRVPIIMLEVMSDSSNAESCAPTTPSANDTTESHPNNEDVPQNTGVHFLTDDIQSHDEIKNNFNDREKEQDTGNSRVKVESVEYVTRGDGSVVCKLCGEILQSRTHWYRHKYKLHVPQALNPAPLFQCEQCLVFFKSRKGYIGHLASRHSEVLSDTSPVLTNAQVEAMAKEQQPVQQKQQIQPQKQNELIQELDPELAIPMSSVPNYQAAAIKPSVTKPTEQKRSYKNTKAPSETQLMNNPEWEEKRIREEKLVSDIINRVRRECEAQGSGAPARRGYNRRTTVMHT